ncbi:MAG: sigma 54-interacting transcriptional regulator [Tepidanaerobacteraceae bacterium]|jgi:transcriptional regulator with AAA-type ATPase domain/transcriptional regulatory protein LevR|nr:sigma 54-interacting transcriptional regulator [Tepidanaerobacteraceae bacterium]
MRDLKKILIDLIQNEDKNNPYTDAQLAKKLNISRYEVTILRNELNIPNSRDRLKPVLSNRIRELMSSKWKISTAGLARELKKQGFDVSRFLVDQIKKEIKKTDMDVNDVETDNSTQNETISQIKSTSFNEIIGFEGSLKPQIQQAKAAILYPPHGLNTLILGPTGSGKSCLAQAMYQFAIESNSLAPDSPFITFNCADYAENSQLLLSQLFGHVKGAFTGAHEHKKGLIEKANRGILFLDEVHRLPPEGQELLYFFMDTGKFRKLGDTETVHSSNVMIIAATTEDIESSLLMPFRRRIPMIIELPSLSSRPLVERYEIIKAFFKKEANRIGISIKVSKEALRVLLLYDCPGNIGQLQSDIQVSCARGFLLYKSNRQKIIEIDFTDLPAHARKAMLKMDSRNSEAEKYFESGFVVVPGMTSSKIIQQDNMHPQDIYDYIEKEYEELQQQGLSLEMINRFIGGELEIKFQQLTKNLKNDTLNLTKQDLANIVGKDVVEVSEIMTKLAENKLGTMENHLFYCLAIHLSTTLERIKQGKPIINPQLDKIKSDYEMEFNIAREMVHAVESYIGYKLPEDEIGFIAMYLRTITNPKSMKKGRIGVIVITHGRVATSICEVVSRLLGINHAQSIDMSLEEKPESALNRTLNLVKEVNEGKGVLLLVDMGSLLTFGEIITQETGIPTRTIGRVDTIMVLEAVRKAILPDADLDEIAESIDKNIKNLTTYRPFKVANIQNQKAIITICITGRGTAKKLKALIENIILEIDKDNSEKIDIIPLGVIGTEELTANIYKIKSEKNIVAIVGTVNPNVPDIPFISIEEIINGSFINKIKNIFNFAVLPEIKVRNEVSGSALSDTINKKLIMLKPDLNTKSEVIENLVNLLVKEKYVKPDFLMDVYRREMLSSTLVRDNVAFPHGSLQNVLKSAIAVALLKKPIEWAEGKYVEMVFLIALKEDSKEIILELYNLVRNKEFIVRAKKSVTPEELAKLLLQTKSQR